MKIEEKFEVIYVLARQQKYKEALNKIYDFKLQDIYSDFNEDENHAWYLVADLFYKLNQMSDAKYAFKKALEHWEEDIDALLGLSNILNTEKNYNEAIEWLKKGLAVKQDDRLIYNYANNLFDQGDFLQAIEQYQKVSQSNPDLYKFAQKNLSVAQQMISALKE